MISVCSFAQVQVGTDTNQFQDGPFDPANVYSYSQSIYLAAEINASGNITELQWYFSGTTLLPNSQDLTIYLGHSTKAEFTSTSDWETLANLTQVYTGGIDVSAGEGWTTITFDTPFVYNGSDNLIVAVDENMADSDANTDDFHNTSVASARSMTYRSFSINPDPAAPLNANAGLDSYVPNIIFGGITETCPIPTGGMALSTTTTTANLDWTIGGSEALWDIELGLAGFIPTGVPTTSGISRPYDASLLTSNTAYEFYLRADCTVGDFSAWNGPFSFRTACDAVIDDFSENFDTMPDDLETPYCWDTIITTTGSDSPSARVDSNFATPDNKYFYMSADEEDTVMLISPNSSTLSDGTRRIEFIAEISNDADSTPISVGTMTDPMDAGTFTELKTIVLTEDYTTYYVNVPPSSDTYFAFKHGTNSSLNRDIYIDDIVVTMQPSCIEVLDVAVTNVTDTQLELTVIYDTQQAQTAWEYIIKAEPAVSYDPDTETMFGSSTSTSITGITTDTDTNPIQGNTEYWVYARANCDGAGSAGSGQSAWEGPFVFRTECAAIIDDFSENFETLPDELMTPYCWNIIVSSTDTAPDIKVNSSPSQSYSPDNYYHMLMNDDDIVYLVSPESSTISDGMHRVEFAAKVNSTSGGDTNFKVGLMSDPNDEGTFLELTSIALDASSSNANNYSLYYVNIPFDATRNHLAFKPETTSEFNKTIYLDDIVVTTQPSCFDVLDVSATAISDVSFDLNLTPDIQVQTEWELVVVQTDLNFNPALETPIVTNTLTTNITLDSDGAAIIPNSPYRVFVRSNCDAVGSEGSGFSNWFGPFDFRTACVPLTTNFSEDFESYVNGDFPACWYKSITSTGSPLVQVSNSSSYAVSGTNSIIMNAGNDADANVLLILPQNTVANDGAHRLEFYARKNNATTDASIIVGTMSDPLDANTFQEVTQVSITTGGTSGADVLYFANLPVSTDEYVVLKHGAGAAASIAFYIDDVTITDQPVCTEVYNVSAENITASSVEVSWDFIGSQTNWEYVVQPLGTGEPTSGTTTTSNILNADFNTLDPNSTYEIYVRADCDTDGTSPWVGPVNFTTSCVAESGTYVHGFEGFAGNDEVAPCWSSLVDPASTSPYVRYSTFQVQEGSVSVRMYTGNDETSGIFLITPMLSDLDNTKQIVFQVYDNDNGALEVGTMTDPTDASTFTSYQTYLDADMTDDAWDEKVFTFSTYTGSDNFIAFRFNGASTFDSLYIDNFTYQTDPTLSINDFDLNSKVSVYPNPVKNILHINGNNIKTVEVYSVNGQHIVTQNSNTENVDVSTLESGMYFLNITSINGHTVVKKFVKQ